MAIFHSYVSIPEGIIIILETSPVEEVRLAFDAHDAWRMWRRERFLFSRLCKWVMIKSMNMKTPFEKIQMVYFFHEKIHRPWFFAVKSL